MERKGSSALTYKHALSDPTELLRRTSFYESAKDQGPGIATVYQLAKKNSLPQLQLAYDVARAVESSPPRHDSLPSLAQYMNSVVLSKIPRKTRYDDTFWCCLLHILDSNNVPNCEIGGNLHNFVYKVYDDFDPQDVLDG